jgi:hypothetical protein
LSNNQNDFDIKEDKLNYNQNYNIEDTLKYIWDFNIEKFKKLPKDNKLTLASSLDKLINQS